MDVNGHTELDDVNVSGAITATTFTGDGAGITGLTANQVGAITDIVSDTTPQLGGDLDVNSNDITGTGNVNLTGVVTATSFSGNGANLTGLTANQVGAITDIVSDTTPQLGGDLDVNSNDITGTGNVNLTGVVTATSFSGSGASLTAVDAATLDGVDSTSFLRSDAADIKTSGTLTFNDTIAARFGTNGDIQIRHSGTQGFFESYNGDIFIDQNATDADVFIRSDDGSGGSTNYFLADGSTGEVILYHYGTQKFSPPSLLVLM